MTPYDMLTRQQQIRFCSSDWKKIISNLELYCTTGDPEALHQLRVSVKKIKALLWLADKCHPQFLLHAEFAPVIQIFKHSGVIRNAQLCMKYLVAQQASNKKLIQSQQRIIQHEFRLFIANRNSYTTQVHETIAPINMHLKNIPNKKVQQVIAKRKRQVEIFFRKDFNLDSLHDHRKKIKSLLYLQPMIKQATGITTVRNVKKWDKLQEMIGHWHDHQSMASLLQNSAGGAGFIAQQQLLDNYIDQIKALADKLVKHSTT